MRELRRRVGGKVCQTQYFTIAARHQVHPNQVSTWKRQAVDGLADVFARGGKADGLSEAEVKDLHAKIGKLAVENDFLSQGFKR